MGRRLRRVLTTARLLAEAALDALRPVHRTPRALPEAGATDVDLPGLSAAARLSSRDAAQGLRPRGPKSAQAGRLRERMRAVRFLLRIVAAIRIPWSCRRSAFTVYRAFAREGVPVDLCFGVRRTRPGGSCNGSYVGHVWADASAGAERPGFPLVIRFPSTGENAGWQRG